MSQEEFTPRFAVPRGACDCHYHIFGPHEDYPPSEGTTHLMPDALRADHTAMRERTGIERMVLVQPGGYYPNNYPMLDILAEEGDAARGIAAYDQFIADAEIPPLHEAGVRGMRMSPGRNVDDERIQVVWDHIMSLALRFEPHGWHLQFLLSGHMRDRLLPMLADVPVPVVIDHLGLFRPERIDGHAGFEALLKLLEHDHVWVKLSGADRVTRDGKFEDAIPVMKALIEAAPNRMVWGTDWPHTGEREPIPEGEDTVTVPYGDVDERKCLAVLADACPDEATFQAILAENPARLYGF